MTDRSPPPRGVRLPWQAVPLRVRTEFESWWGRRVVGATSLESGFSPGVAARLRAADGSGVFVKAIGPEPNPQSPDFHRREIVVASHLPDETPAPKLLWWLDEGDGVAEGDAGWVLLAFEELAGASPSVPWRVDTLDRVIEALSDLASALTPNPLPSGTVPDARDAFATWIGGWRNLAQGGASERPLDRWSQRHLSTLAELETNASDAAAGASLLHFDLRADNIVLEEERVCFVDWPHAHVGAPWIDAVLMAPSVAMQGGPDPEAFVSRLPSFRAAPPEAVTSVLAAVAGFLTYSSLQAPPPGLPTVRAFQAAQGWEARRWLAARMGWTPPDGDS